MLKRKPKYGVRGMNDPPVNDSLGKSDLKKPLRNEMSLIEMSFVYLEFAMRTPLSLWRPQPVTSKVQNAKHN